MDASVQRIQTEPVVTGPRAGSRTPERRRRERGRGEAGSAPEHEEYTEPRQPKGDGLGEQLDVTA